MSDYLMIDKSLNVNKIDNYKFKLSEHPDLEEAIVVLPNGDIIEIRKDLIVPYLESHEISMYREGRKKIPRIMKLENKEDFLKIIAINISLEEYR